MTVKDFCASGLKETEAEIVHRLVISGMSNSEIADDMDLNVRTIKFHLTSIYKKWGVKSRTQLVVKILTQRTLEVAAV